MRTTEKAEESAQSGGQRRKRGRPPAEIDLKLVEDLAAIGATDEEIAAVLRVSTDTIGRRKKDPAFRDVLEAGKGRGRVTLRRLQWQAASTGNTTMLVWLGKQMLGQRDKWEDTSADSNQPLPWTD